jgi:hypothetical protein
MVNPQTYEYRSFKSTVIWGKKGFFHSLWSPKYVRFFSIRHMSTVFVPSFPWFCISSCSILQIICTASYLHSCVRKFLVVIATNHKSDMNILSIATCILLNPLPCSQNQMHAMQFPCEIFIGYESIYQQY